MKTYTSGGIVSFSIHRDAEADLRSIRERDLASAGKLLALLQELKADGHLRERLLTHDGKGRPGVRFNVSKWFEFWHQGLNIWRLKIWALEHSKLAYRIIYAYVVRTKSFHVLAVVHRSEIDYDNVRDALNLRIRRAYDDIR